MGSDPQSERMDEREVEELYPAVLMLEATAVVHTPPYDAVAIARLREANEQLLAARDAPTAARADDLFHLRQEPPSSRPGTSARGGRSSRTAMS